MGNINADKLPTNSPTNCRQIMANRQNVKGDKKYDDKIIKEKE